MDSWCRTSRFFSFGVACALTNLYCILVTVAEFKPNWKQEAPVINLVQLLYLCRQIQKASSLPGAPAALCWPSFIIWSSFDHVPLLSWTLSISSVSFDRANSNFSFVRNIEWMQCLKSTCIGGILYKSKERKDDTHMTHFPSLLRLAAGETCTRSIDLASSQNQSNECHHQKQQ